MDAGRAVCPICRTPAAGPAVAAPPRFPAAAGPAPPTAPVRAPAAAPRKYRIPCPRGHVLKAGGHMLGQQVVCPECNELFLLREADSLEHRKLRDHARRAEEERIAKLWLTRSIWAAAFIVASLVGMIAFSFAFRAPPPPPLQPPADHSTEPDPAARTE